jgi:hypothetical protein
MCQCAFKAQTDKQTYPVLENIEFSIFLKPEGVNKINGIKAEKKIT